MYVCRWYGVCVCARASVCVGMQELNRSYDAAKAQLATNDTFTQVYYNYSIRTHTHMHARMHAHTCTHTHVRTHIAHMHTHTHCISSLLVQLGNLERKWQHLEQNNFVLKECILL